MPPPLPTMPVEEDLADDHPNGQGDADVDDNDAEQEDDAEDPEDEVVESEVPEKTEENPEAFGDLCFWFFQR